jgi:hypothetical protein
MNEKSFSTVLLLLFASLLLASLGAGGYLVYRLRAAERAIVERDSELGGIRAERDNLAERFTELTGQLNSARGIAGGLRVGLDRIADASGRRIAALRDAIDALRETAEAVEELEDRVHFLEWALGSASPDTAAVETE